MQRGFFQIKGSFCRLFIAETKAGKAFSLM